MSVDPVALLARARKKVEETIADEANQVRVFNALKELSGPAFRHASAIAMFAGDVDTAATELIWRVMRDVGVTR